MDAKTKTIANDFQEMRWYRVVSVDICRVYEDPLI